MTEGVFPKSNGDVLYASEANSLNYVNVLAGENLTAGNIVYIKKSDGKAYVSDTGTADDIRADGVVKNSPLSGVVAYVLTRGNYVTSGLTANEVYYLAASGAISTTVTAVQVGIASSTTNLFVDIVQDDRDAVGTIKAWAKSLTGVPALSAFWVECDSRGALSDAESPINGQTVPNLNVAGRYLKGATTSGTTAGTAGAHIHGVIEKFVSGAGDFIIAVTGVSSGTGQKFYDVSGVQQNITSPTTSWYSQSIDSTQPNYTVVYILKVK